MSAPTVLRVKRLRSQDPSDMIVLSARKRKADCDSGDENNFKILRLATTVENKSDTAKLNEAVDLIKKKNTPKSFEELKENYKKRFSAKPDHLEQAKDNRDENRFRLVSQKRAIRLEELEDWSEVGEHGQKNEDTESSVEDTKELFRMYDVVNESTPENSEKKPLDEKISCNGVEMIREYVTKPEVEEGSYVYDFYYSEGSGEGREGGDFDDSLLDGLFSIQPFNSGEDLMYSEYRDKDGTQFGEDEDSNDEDNYKNDYPDESDDSEDGSYRGYCDDDGEMGFRIKGLGLDDDSDNLSSDAEDELVFTRSFNEDAYRHGASYARFKQNIMKEFGEEDEDEAEEDA